MRKTISLLLTVSLLLVCFASCAEKSNEGYYHRTQRNEYGRLSISLSRTSKDSGTLLENELKSIYDGTCEAFEKAYLSLTGEGYTADINEAVNKVFDLDEKFTKHLSQAFRLSDSTDGLYQPCGGALTSLYASKKEPSEDEINEALSHIGCDKFDVSKTSVTKKDPLAAVDLYSYADAYALSRAVAYLEKSDVLYGTVTFNGIAGVFGEKPDGEPFVIDISDGSDAGKDGSFSVTEGYVALVSDGFGYAYDFRDGTVDTELAKVTVYSKDPITAAVAASIGYSYGADTLFELYKNDEFSFEAVVTDNDGKVTYTDNAEKGKLYTPDTLAENEE